MTQQQFEALEDAFVGMMHDALAKRIKTCLADPSEKLPVPYNFGMMAYRWEGRVQVFEHQVIPAESKEFNHGG